LTKKLFFICFDTTAGLSALLNPQLASATMSTLSAALGLTAAGNAGLLGNAAAAAAVAAHHHHAHHHTHHGLHHAHHGFVVSSC